MIITRVETLVDVAREVGIEIPSDLREFDGDEFPHWKLFCIAQIDRSIPNKSAVLENAKTIVAIEKGKAAGMTFQDITINLYRRRFDAGC